MIDLVKAREAMAYAARNVPKVTTPKEPLSYNVLSLCREVNPDATPVFLPFTDVGRDYPKNYCHINVKHSVRHHGGKQIFGWMIWENSRFAEAEFHSVWELPDGTLQDVSPRIDGEEMILFLPDPNTSITRGERGDITPANRTTVKHCPYIMSGVPMDSKDREIEYDAAGLALFAKWGIDPPTNAPD